MRFDTNFVVSGAPSTNSWALFMNFVPPFVLDWELLRNRTAKFVSKQVKVCCIYYGVIVLCYKMNSRSCVVLCVCCLFSIHYYSALCIYSGHRMLMEHAHTVNTEIAYFF